MAHLRSETIAGSCIYPCVAKDSGFAPTLVDVQLPSVVNYSMLELTIFAGYFKILP